MTTAQVPELRRVQRCSNYLGTLIRKRPDFADWLWAQKRIYRRYPLTELYQELKGAGQRAGDMNDLLRTFREFKQRHFLRIGSRDLLGWAPLEETTAQLSDLACVALQVGLELLSEYPQWWASERDAGLWLQLRQEHRLVVMGLGKLGGEELNYVSDVDICFYREARKNSSPYSDQSVRWVNRLCQSLSRLLAEQMDGDRVFQVDLRLRPGGKEGELVPTVEGASEHYLNQGRSWERQVLLKARPVAGERSLGMGFLHEIRPFIYRRFLDFQALDELRSMRDRILDESIRLRRHRLFDVKLGEGGIREIEFIVQSFQLVYGGRHPELEERNTLRCLAQLRRLQLLPDRVIRELHEAYTFLRRIEHWIQLDQNRQTQKLPSAEESRKRLALAMDFGDDPDGLIKTLQHHCALVHQHFRSLFHSSTSGASKVESEEVEIPVGVEAFGDGLPAVHDREEFAPLNVVLADYPEQVRQTVMRVMSSFAVNTRTETLQSIVVRAERYFTQVRRRPGLVRGLQAGSVWLPELCRTMVQSGLVSDLLCHQPGLIDGLSESFKDSNRCDAWERSYNRILSRDLDFEEAMEWIRRLKNERILVLALNDLAGRLTQHQLEEQLSDLADFVIRQTYSRVLTHVGEQDDLPLAVLALGKLGSRELNYLSDLDIIFVYDPRPDEPADRIPLNVVRLIQRFNRMLSVPLQEGPGYEVDTRLRPTGNYGPLVVTRKAWEQYYTEEADLWEIQALLRMRSVAGEADLCGHLAEKSVRFCRSQFPREKVWGRLCHLRSRMEAERGGDRPGWLDLKLGLGGVVDLEFLVQGSLLIASPDSLPSHQGNVRKSLTAVLAEACTSAAEQQDFTHAFEALRALEHRLHLHFNFSTSKLSEEQFAELLELDLWPPAGERVYLEDWQDFVAARRRIRTLWNRVCESSAP